ncbi:Beta-mannanase/endoglucanase A [Burkholderiales bacterium]|nr:Beta-mannanase/endoglucanase A [Burkholderiales bacterium]
MAIAAPVSAVRHIAACCLSLLFHLGAAFGQNAQVNIQVDASADRRAINPYIYGVAFASTSAMQDLNAPLHRWGGNYTSRYNWQQDADNRAADWYFESVPEGSGTPGWVVDDFIERSKAANAEPMITMPLLDWVAKLGAGRSKLASFSQAKYGEQTDADWSWFPDAGNGVLAATGQNITGNDPNDANVANSTALQNGFVQHLLTRWGSAANGGLRYYLMDNEHSIWFGTHRDVAPVGATMEQIRQKMIDYGTIIRLADPGAKIVGPEEWGWLGMLYSGYDQQYAAAHGWSSFPDRAAHGNMDYLPWLLNELRLHEQSTGRRLLDVFTVHYYPQGGEYGNNTSTSMQLRRNRSTRSLWDPDYTDETWVNAKVMLIPRLRQWVASYYPGLQTGVTEYNWGAEGHINGATAQADVLGIFGREGLDFGARWTTPASNTPTYKAMKMYRNYDGNLSGFGDTSVRATVPNPDELSAFAALRSGDGALTIMVVNKVLSGTTPIQIALGAFAANGSAQVWQLTAANSITRLADISVSGNLLGTTVPAQSITLLVLAPSTKVQRAYVSAAAGSDVNTSSQCGRSAPCRSFAAAVGVVASGGEVVALDSGDYGSVTLANSVTLIAAPGKQVSIGATSGNAVTVATPGVKAVLRGLHLAGFGAANGIFMSAGAGLSVENCVITGFGASGIDVSAAAQVSVTGSMLRNNAVGVKLEGAAKATLQSVKILGSSSEGVVVAKSVPAGGATTASLAGTIIAGGGWGVRAGAAGTTGTVIVNITRSRVLNHGGGGVRAVNGGGSTGVTLGRSLISGNAIGLQNQGGIFRSSQNNTFSGNGTDVSGTITGLSPS